MPFALIEESEWRKVHALSENADDILRNAEKLAAGLRMIFQDAETSAMGVEIGEPDEARVIQVASPAGTGRMRFEFCFLENGLAGRYVIERRDPRAPADTWKAVWAIGVGRSIDGFWMGDDRTAPGAKFGFKDPKDCPGLFAAGMSTVYAVIQGFQKA